MTEPNNGVSLQNNGKKEKRGYKKKAFTFYIYFSDMSGRQVAKNWILGYHNASGIFKLTDFSSCPEKYLSLSKNEEKHRSTLLKTNFLLIRDTWKTENPILGTLYPALILLHSELQKLKCANIVIHHRVVNRYGANKRKKTKFHLFNWVGNKENED